MRGLDVAFMEPRARYHTVEDSTRFTSVNSLWHMLSAAIATMQGLSSDTSSTFDGDATVPGGVKAGSGTDSVWFDLFGKTFAILRLHTLFAISVTMLVVTPLILIGLNVWLSKIDRWYLFARKSYPSSEEDDFVSIYGWKGFFRFPIVFVVATAALVGLAFLVTKINPYITYSSQYSVWRYVIESRRLREFLLILRQYDAYRLVCNCMVFAPWLRRSSTFSLSKNLYPILDVHRRLCGACWSYSSREQL